MAPIVQPDASLAVPSPSMTQRVAQSQPGDSFRPFAPIGTVRVTNTALVPVCRGGHGRAGFVQELRT